jgi:hypothetical protein
MKTAVEKLVAHLIEYGFDLSAHKLEIEQAKEMEKSQIIDAYQNGSIDGHIYALTRIENGEQYYNETFNK